MAAADHQRERRELDASCASRITAWMWPFDMVDGDQRHACRETQRFGVGEADEQRADADPGPTVAAMAERSSSGVPARSSASRTTGTMARRCSREASSGTTPPYLPCMRHLRRDDGREHRLAVFDDGGGGLVAGGFDAQNAHSLLP